jgi:hypothetical protein
MHCQFKNGMEGAEDNVVGHPCQQKPAAPVAAAKHQDSGNNREKSQDEHPDNFVTKRVLRTQFSQVVHQPNNAGSDEKPTDDGNRQRSSFHQVQAFRLGRDGWIFHRQLPPCWYNYDIWPPRLPSGVTSAGRALLRLGCIFREKPLSGTYPHCRIALPHLTGL